uniref:Uncharacterized protein n=1 Tax=Lepeophtheirus salmonis TaxID=72036 RepID=A0A0K2VDT9_LEPSM
MSSVYNEVYLRFRKYLLRTTVQWYKGRFILNKVMGIPFEGIQCRLDYMWKIWHHSWRVIYESLELLKQILMIWSQHILNQTTRNTQS